MRLHRLDTTPAVRLSPARAGPAGRRRRRPGAGPVAPSPTSRPPRASSGAARTAIAQVHAEAAQWRADMPYLQLALELARGTRLMLSGDLAGIDAIVADEFADLAGAGDFRLGTGYLAILQAYAARLRGQSDEAHADQPGRLRGAGHQPGLRRPGPRRARPGGGAARRRGAGRRGDGRSGPHPRARHGGALPVAGAGPGRGRSPHRATCRARPSTSATLADRLRADGFAGHEVLVLHDLVRLDQAGTPVGPTCSDGGRRPSRSAWPSCPSRSTGCCRRCWPGTPARPSTDSADRPARGRRRLRRAGADRVRRGGHRAGACTGCAGSARAAAGAARERLADLLGRCDLIRTPALRRRRAGAHRPGVAGRRASPPHGVTSRAIAERLYLSPRTVENHLQRVYASSASPAAPSWGPRCARSRATTAATRAEPLGWGGEHPSPRAADRPLRADHGQRRPEGRHRRPPLRLRGVQPPAAQPAAATAWSPAPAG